MSLHLRGVDQEADLLTTAQAMPPGHLTYWGSSIACGAADHCLCFHTFNQGTLQKPKEVYESCRLQVRFNLSGGTTAEFSGFNSYKTLQHASKKGRRCPFKTISATVSFLLSLRMKEYACIKLYEYCMNHEVNGCTTNNINTHQLVSTGICLGRAPLVPYSTDL